MYWPKPRFGFQGYKQVLYQGEAGWFLECRRGAAGSIGSEIVRQLVRFAPEKIILVDQAESALFDFDYELNANFKDYLSQTKIEIIVANVTDENRLRKIFRKNKPDIVFHAAAYKHVPLMENNPYEAVKVNILGTKNVADLSVEFELVLEAGAMGNGSEVFVFDMGQPVKVVDLAKKMIQLSGFQEGLRPGEKLYEELLNDNENTLPTHHIQEAYAKAKWKAFELYAGRRKEIQGLVDTTLTSGSYIWSGNTLPMPKIDLSIQNYTSLG
ncbi:hypothetical protein B566_EDAN018889, partial [Ephemera danica]